ncbi:MAG: ComF family protein [Arenimonas sp.]
MLSGLIAKLSSLLLAPCCLLCAGHGHSGLDLCIECSAALPWNRDACRQCGLPLSADSDHCGQCQLSPPPFTLTQSAFRYAFPVDRLLPRFKFHGDLAAGALLAALMQWSLDPAERPSLLIPVPLHCSRLRQRGYDQALELARILARESGLPVSANRLLRRRATQAQTELGASARERNVRGAFALRPGPALPAHVALVDDVMTTGATLAECANVLLAAGVQRVDVWTVARAI